MPKTETRGSSFRSGVLTLKHVALGALLLACTVAGCGMQPFRPQALSPEATADQFYARSPDEPSVRIFFEQSGVRIEEWPLKYWGVTELTLLALHFHPDLDAARANVAVFEAAMDVAAMPGIPSAKPLLEHHGKADAGQSRWSYGLELELPLSPSDKREARLEQARSRMESARVAAVATSWQVASRVQRQLVDVFLARRETELAERELEIAATANASAQRQLSAGTATRTEAIGALRTFDQASLRLEQARARAERARALLAEAVGLSPDALRNVQLNFSKIESLPPPPMLAQAREAALTDRADIRRALLSYDEADAALKLAVANQYPDLAIKPGYLWDQGDQVWLLALTIPLQLLQDRSAPVREAEARRELAASNFMALQAQTIAQVEVALVNYRAGVGALEKAALLEKTAGEQSARAERALAAGAADRGEVLAADTALVEAARERLNAFATAQRARLDLEDATQRRLSGPAADPRKPAMVGGWEAPW